MQESTVVQGWINRGVQKGALEQQRRDLLRVVQNKFQTTIPEPIRLAVEGTNDSVTLERWLDAAVTVATLAEFRAAMQQTP